MTDARLWLYLLLAAGVGFALFIAARELGRGFAAGVQEYRSRAEPAGPAETSTQDDFSQHQDRSEDKSAPPPPRDEPPQARAWHEVLGVAENASLFEIKAAYRSAIALYHPDRLVGLAPELQALAEQRAKEINAAYETGCALAGPP